MRQGDSSGRLSQTLSRPSGSGRSSFTPSIHSYHSFQNIEFDGREISASELAEALETSAKELLSWLGEGKRQKKELRNKFEKYFGEDGKTYIRRKGAQECSQP